MLNIEIVFYRNSDLQDSNISTGDSLIVSYEDLSRLCIAWSTVTDLSRCRLVVSTGTVDLTKHKFDESGQTIELRLDKCEYYRPSAIVLMNLIGFYQRNERSIIVSTVDTGYKNIFVFSRRCSWFQIFIGVQILATLPTDVIQNYCFSFNRFPLYSHLQLI